MLGCKIYQTLLNNWHVNELKVSCNDNIVFVIKLILTSILTKVIALRYSKKLGVQIQDFKEITNPLRGIFRIFSNLTKKNQKMSMYNRLVSGMVGSQVIMPKNLPGHCSLTWTHFDLQT